MINPREANWSDTPATGHKWSETAERTYDDAVAIFDDEDVTTPREVVTRFPEGAEL